MSAASLAMNAMGSSTRSVAPLRRGLRCRVAMRPSGTIEFLRGLPFVEIGRCVIFGLEANDHAPAHRDTEPGSALGVAQSISFAPRGGKRFYVCDREGEERTVVRAPIYRFNDMDYHGVEPDPFFRYSIRVDGVFEPAFVKRLQRLYRR